MKFIKAFLFSFILIGQSCSVWALSSDSKQPLHLIADTAKMNNNTGISVYTGNVKVTQGSMELLGNVVTVYSKDNKILKVVSTGNKTKQAFYTEEQDNNAGPIKAWADKITYDADTNKVTLLDSARVVRPGEDFTGEFIQYNRISKTVHAHRAKDSSKRVQIIFQPKNNTPPPTSKK